jgi:HAMP domain-containing protein
MRISTTQRAEDENRIRAVMDRLLRGDIPPGGRCDIKTLAREAAVDRAAFYGSRPYARLREEFETRLAAIRHDGSHPDPRDAQIGRLKTEIATLKERLSRQDQTIARLTDVNAQALARLAAQHEEITRFRRNVDATAAIRRLPTRTP